MKKTLSCGLLAVGVLALGGVGLVVYVDHETKEIEKNINYRLLELSKNFPQGVTYTNKMERGLFSSKGRYQLNVNVPGLEEMNGNFILDYRVGHGIFDAIKQSFPYKGIGYLDGPIVSKIESVGPLFDIEGYAHNNGDFNTFLAARDFYFNDSRNNVKTKFQNLTAEIISNSGAGFFDFNVGEISFKAPKYNIPLSISGMSIQRRFDNKNPLLQSVSIGMKKIDAYFVNMEDISLSVAVNEGNNEYTLKTDISFPVINAPAFNQSGSFKVNYDFSHINKEIVRELEIFINHVKNKGNDNLTEEDQIELSKLIIKAVKSGFKFNLHEFQVQTGTGLVDVKGGYTLNPTAVNESVDLIKSSAFKVEAKATKDAAMIFAQSVGSSLGNNSVVFNPHNKEVTLSMNYTNGEFFLNGNNVSNEPIAIDFKKRLTEINQVLKKINTVANTTVPISSDVK